MLKPLRPLPPGDANVLKGTSQKPKVNVNLKSHRNEVPEEFKSCQAQGKDRWMVGYITYYVFQLLVNQALVSVYAVFVFGEQVVCQTDSDVQDKLDVAFLIGFTVVMVDMINQTLIHSYLRFKVEETDSLVVSCMYSISNAAAWILRVLLVLVSVTQMITVFTVGQSQCLEDSKIALLG